MFSVCEGEKYEDAGSHLHEPGRSLCFGGSTAVITSSHGSLSYTVPVTLFLSAQLSKQLFTGNMTQELKLIVQ